MAQAPSDWNSLPLNIRLLSSFPVSKKSLVFTSSIRVFSEFDIVVLMYYVLDRLENEMVHLEVFIQSQ